MLAGVIFVAAALVLPTGHGDYPSDLGAYFEQDRKWAVAALAARGVVGAGTNVVVMGGSIVSGLQGLILAQVAAALLFLFSKGRRLKVAATVLYGLTLSVASLLAMG